MMTIRINGAALLMAAAIGLVSSSVYANAGEDAGVAVNAAASGADSIELNKAIDEVISRPEYAWRLPRSKEAEVTESSSFAGKFFDMVRKAADYVVRFLRWLDRWLNKLFAGKERERNVNFDWQIPVLGLWYMVAAAVCSVLAVALYRLWRNYRRRSTAKTASAMDVVPDITDEGIQPDVLPSDEWMKIAHDFLAKGELRLAVRAMFLACLACLADAKRITPAKYKSNRDYFTELSRKAHDTPAVLSAFRENVDVIEEAWYGLRPVSMETVALFEQNRLRIFEGAGTENNAVEGGWQLHA
jgi:hypothetical protein